MKPNLFMVVSAVLLVLAGCAPLSIYHRDGVAVTRMQSDLLSCEVAAINDVPVANQLRQTAPFFVPGRRVCYNNGRCQVRGGYFVPGEIYTVDVNRGLRGRVQNQCMAEKGYTPVTLPNCSNSVARQVPQAATQTLPPVSDKSCAIRNGDGSWQIVTVK